MSMNISYKQLAWIISAGIIVFAVYSLYQEYILDHPGIPAELTQTLVRFGSLSLNALIIFMFIVFPVFFIAFFVYIIKSMK